ncbi:glycosyltransferase [Flavobacterium aquiphilum]|uniref:glycosyltransferase n=1 Tax=Flavobacterium aquiphilum TaxID=3003261 RepID=UPI00248022CF|nr:glycosyltransferase [Flavobacterium aquiphilum]
MILPHKKYKIALIGYRLSGGGSDKVMANLSLFFAKNNIDVHIIIVLDEVTYPYSGKLVNLGLLKNKTNGVFNKIKRLISLRKYLKENEFDFIIDFRFRTKILQELLLARLIYNAKTIFTVHSFLIDHYMPNNSWLTRLIYNHCYANVVLTQEMEELIVRKHKLNNVVTIPNPVNLEEICKKSNDSIDLDFEYIIAIGQYENNIKQFDKLILAYANSELSKKKIHLVIVGEGNDEALKKVAGENGVIDFVHFLGYQNNPFKYLKKAKFLVLSSKNEGLPNVILEALACEVPVVSFDCPCGPRTIIKNKENGILVENQNWDKLSEAMNEFVNDEKLYQYCKQNAKESIGPFLLDTIGNQWLDLMQINTI